MSSANKYAKWDCLSEPSASPVQSQDLAGQFGLQYEAPDLPWAKSRHRITVPGVLPHDVKSLQIALYSSKTQTTIADPTTDGSIPPKSEGNRGAQVYAKNISNTLSTALMPIRERKLIPDNMVYSDGLKGNYVLDISNFFTLGSTIPNSM